MAYEKLHLPNGTVLNEEHLEHIENGIANSGGIGSVDASCAASGEYAHAEGYGCIADGVRSHAEGYWTHANGENTHCEGRQTYALGKQSHAEGSNTYVHITADNAHAEGYHTFAYSKNQHVQGKYNIKDENDKYAHIVGNGNSEDACSNAHTVDWDGNAWYAGYVECTAIILTSPNGTRWQITVDDTGTLSAAEIISE